MYNALVFLTGVMPGESVGLAVIALTILVKFFILPLQHGQKKNQQRMQAIQPELQELQHKHKDDRAAQAQAMMDLYREHDIKPFSGFLSLFIQLPIIWALYWVFIKGLPFSTERLYGFVTLPDNPAFTLFGLFDLATNHQLILAILVGVTLYYQIKLSMPPIPKRKKGAEPNFGEDLARSMNLNMRFVMPLIMTFATWSFPAVVGLYFLTTNIFSIIHELFVAKEAKNILATEAKAS